MKSYMKITFLASMACILSATEFTDLYLFFPLLQNIKIPTCPPNEMYTICTSQCSDCLNRGKCITNECEKACDCVPHFYRLTPDGPCQPVAKCPKPECGENEVFRECGPICERCTTVMCQAINCEHKCYCKKGYLRNEDGKCVEMNECQKRKRCYRNEEWAESGLVHEFCLPKEGGTAIDKMQNVPQCYCKEGYKRNTLGHCVNETLCPLLKCPGVEIYHECIPKCNTTCRNYGNPNCIEDDNCYPGCFCPPGYVMNDLRSCIPVENCSLDIKPVKIEIPDEEEEDEESSVIDEDEESSVIDEDEESPVIDANAATTVQAVVDIGDASEASSEDSFIVIEEDFPLTTIDVEPTEDSTTHGTKFPDEDRKGSIDKHETDNEDDNNTAK